MGKNKASDLLKAFGLSDADFAAPAAPASGGGGSPPSVVKAADTPAAPGDLPDHALKVDRWGVRRGRELLEGEYAQSLSPLDLGPDLDTRRAAAADLFASCFEPEPVVRDGCKDGVRHEFFQKLVEQEDYHALHTQTALDATYSEIAAVKFAEKLAELRAAREKPRERKPGQTDDDAKLDAELEAIEAAAGAVAEAAKEVELAKDAAAACGIGGDGGDSGMRIPPKAVSALFQRVKGDPALRRICELAGRFRRLAQGKQRNRLGHGYDDMVGVEPGGDVGRLVSSELAALATPGLFYDVAIRLVENRALCREHKGVEPVGKGPIVVTVDESGSMAGEPVATAKALALAMAWIARSQKRWCCLVGFSGGTDGNFCVLPPGRWDEARLCDWLTHFYGRGTDLDVPVEVVPANWERLVASGMQRGKCDMIMITDALVRLPARLEESFKAFKKREQVKLTALVIQSKPGDLARVADEVFEVDAIAVASEAVETVVSI